MLGNGFSISWRPDIFNYKKLAGKLSDTMMQDLLDKVGTKDLKFLRRRLFKLLKL